MLGYKIKEIQENISSSTVLVVGAGGIGNIVSYFLNTIGIKKQILVDDDKIELSNLNRQFLFREEDIERHKVDIIKRELVKLRKDSNIIAIKEKLNQDILYSLEKIDLVICSADDEYCIDMINDFCCKREIPLINVGYLNDISVIGPFYIPYIKNSCCLCCDKSIYLENNIENYKVNEINRRVKAPSALINNFFSGAMLGSELIKFFSKDYNKIQSINTVLGIHNKDFKLEKITIDKNSHCLYCGGKDDKKL